MGINSSEAEETSANALRNLPARGSIRTNRLRQAYNLPRTIRYRNVLFRTINVELIIRLPILHWEAKRL